MRRHRILQPISTLRNQESNHDLFTRGIIHTLAPIAKPWGSAVLYPQEARHLLDAIDVSTPAGLRDRALIGLMVYSFARIGAVLAMKVEDVYVQCRNRQLVERVDVMKPILVRSIVT